jgi:metallo-beta-lactamase family protein
MTISFHGAARTVTGTKHLITLKNGTKILLDCGLFQGLGAETDELNLNFGFNPAEVDVLLLSHAHIDHSGLIPKLVRDGFAGKIWCTEATRDLTEILLYDSAEIQTYETESINKKRTARNLPPYEPLYAPDDVTEALKRFQVIEYNNWTEISDGVSVCFTNSGHLVGSAAIHLKIQEDGKDTRITFSGDVGRQRSVLLQAPAPFDQTDYLILESTYGDKHHDLTFKTVDTLLKWIKKTCISKGGKLVIPAFSVGRTQEILYALNQLSLEKRLPQLLYFVDSPLSLKATEVIKKYKESYNERLQQVLKIDADPFDFEGLRYVESVEDSRKLMAYTEPCVIISASGTADAGRVRHHISNCIDDASNTVLLAGYCSTQSTGGKLLSGAKELELFGDPCAVYAEVDQLSGMSAHGDSDELCQFVACQEAANVQHVFLVHGEYKVQQEFATRLGRKGFQYVSIPAQHDVFECQP